MSTLSTLLARIERLERALSLVAALDPEIEFESLVALALDESDRVHERLRDVPAPGVSTVDMSDPVMLVLFA